MFMHFSNDHCREDHEAELYQNCDARFVPLNDLQAE